MSARSPLPQKGPPRCSDARKNAVPISSTSADPISPAAISMRVPQRLAAGQPRGEFARADGQRREHGNGDRRSERHREGGEDARPEQAWLNAKTSTRMAPVQGRIPTESASASALPQDQRAFQVGRGGHMRVSATVRVGVMRGGRRPCDPDRTRGRGRAAAGDWRAAAARLSLASCATRSQAPTAATNPQLTVSIQLGRANLQARRLHRDREHANHGDRGERLDEGRHERQQDAATHGALVGEHVRRDDGFAVSGPRRVQHAISEADEGEHAGRPQRVAVRLDRLDRRRELAVEALLRGKQPRPAPLENAARRGARSAPGAAPAPVRAPSPARAARRAASASAPSAPARTPSQRAAERARAGSQARHHDFGQLTDTVFPAPTIAARFRSGGRPAVAPLASTSAVASRWPSPRQSSRGSSRGRLAEPDRVLLGEVEGDEIARVAHGKPEFGRLGEHRFGGGSVNLRLKHCPCTPASSRWERRAAAHAGRAAPA